MIKNIKNWIVNHFGQTWNAIIGIFVLIICFEILSFTFWNVVPASWIVQIKSAHVETLENGYVFEYVLKRSVLFPVKGGFERQMFCAADDTFKRTRSISTGFETGTEVVRVEINKDHDRRNCENDIYYLKTEYYLITPYGKRRAINKEPIITNNF